MQAISVSVEIHLAPGLPSLSIVGLPATVVKESKDRVRSAIINSHFQFPVCRVTVNLAPADFPKEGGRFDLPIAIGILAASQQISQNALHTYEFAGELALSGELRPINSVVPFAIACRAANHQLIIPHRNAEQASLISQLTILPCNHLLDVCHHLMQTNLIVPFKAPTSSAAPLLPHLDLKDVYGQTAAKRALEITAAGGHSLLLCGPPGTGKTMLATRLPGLLPPLRETEALESAAIYSISHQTVTITDLSHRPFRAPHHTASHIALVGGGNPPRPGEISLAHHGVLFLDELPEFKRQVLETLREPLESQRITISRAAWQVEFPACFQLIAAMNPCPCGYAGDPAQNCRCTAEAIKRYHAKLSGPLLDRIDLQVSVPPLPISTITLRTIEPSESSETIRQRVIAARNYQIQTRGVVNSALKNEALLNACYLGNQSQQLLERAISQFRLSARSTHRILRVARTIADLAGSKIIEIEHLQESLGYRQRVTLPY